VRIRWTGQAEGDVVRLVDFVASYDAALADELEDELSQAPKSLLQFPRRGPRLTQFEPREVREFRVGKYLLRYELAGADIFVLRFFHKRENRLG
jgi:plasmid stabilization system protein ParE